MLRTTSKLVLAVLVIVTLVHATFAGSVYALSGPDSESLGWSSELYWPSQCALQAGGGGGNTATNPGNTAWNSGLQPPYYLEEFAINVLEDLAQATHTSPSTTVTQEHVIALVAWFWAEGGDTMNSDIFNPLNAGLDDPALVAGASNQSGLESFKSFDAGVEALTIMFTSANQNRIGGVLTQSGTTAEQVMNAVTYYQNYPGNKLWAGSDVPGAAQQKYLDGLLKNVSQARTNYAKEASTILGTPALEGATGARVPSSLLKYNTTGVNLPGSGGGGTTSASGGACGTNTSTATSSPIAGCANPLRDVMKKNLQPGRIDEGVDYTVSGPGAPVYAPCAGTIVSLKGPNGSPTWDYVFIVEQLSSDPSKYMYIAENCTPIVPVGAQVTSASPICNMFDGGWGIEIGWAQDPSKGGIAMAYSEYTSDGLATNFGLNYSQFLQKLGAPAGILKHGPGITANPLPAGWPTWQ